jgi:hypothetical protein
MSQTAEQVAHASACLFTFFIRKKGRAFDTYDSPAVSSATDSTERLNRSVITIVLMTCISLIPVLIPIKYW